FGKLKERLFKSSSRLSDGLDEIVAEAPAETAAAPDVVPPAPAAPEETRAPHPTAAPVAAAEPQPAPAPPSPPAQPTPPVQPTAAAQPAPAPARPGLLARLTGEGEARRLVDD